MTARRRRVVVPSAERPPDILLRGFHSTALTGLVPAEFNHGPRDIRTIEAARTIRAVARARWREVTGGGHPTWKIPALMPNEKPMPAALRRAGERLAEDLLKH